MRRDQLRWIVVVILLSILLAACGKATATPGPSQTTAAPVEATPTATQAPQQLIYISSAPSDSDPNISVLSQFASQNSLQLVQSNVFDQAALNLDVRIVVLQTAPDHLVDLAGSHPQVQFILLSDAGIPAGSNLSIISAKPEDLYFMAGYLATLIAYDWRSAALLVGDSPLGAGETDAFFNGGKYVCGKCNPSYPPLVDLPQVTALPAASSSAEWLAAANAMLAYGVNVMFVDPAAATPEVLSTLLNANVSLLGLTDPPAGYENIWAATLSSNASSALQQVLAKALQGEGGQSVTVPVTLTHVNPEFVSPARQDLFNQTSNMLSSGQIGALSVP